MGGLRGNVCKERMVAMGLITEIRKKIEQDRENAEKYLLSGARDNTRCARAVDLLEKELDSTSRCLLDARRELEKKREYKSRCHWVIKTQFIYNRLAEERGLKCTWISESKIKRQWKQYINIVSEMAIRLDERQK